MATSNPTTDAVQAAATDSHATVDSGQLMRTVLPYVIAIVAQLPLLILYYRWLMNRPHYSSWFAFAILATAGLIWARWPKDGRQMFMESIWSNLLAGVGLVAGLLGVVFVEPWFAALSVYSLLASLMARTVDRETGKSLWVTTLPLFASLALPFNYDITLITWLQTTSAHLTSRLLDLANIGHYMPGTVIETPNKKYGVEEACSGIQSFFLLVFVAVAYCVWLRRPLFRSVLLLIAAVIWSIFMNCLRILLIPVFDVNFGIDLSTGIQHDLLGWSTMALGILLLLSTDQFLMFLFGPVDPGTGASGPLGRFITRIWNNIIAGGVDDEETKSRRRSRRQPLSSLSKGVAWTVAGLMVVAGLLAIYDILQSYSAPSKTTVNFFSGRVIYPLGKDGMPEVVKDWNQVDYVSDERTRASDLGQQSDSWIFQSPSRFFASASFDQTFPGWHELTRCYRNQGWVLEEREWKKQPDRKNEEELWPYIEARLSKPTGETGILLFSLFDGEGRAFDPPKKWGFMNYLLSGAQNRLAERVRKRLFQSEGYQTQVFVQGYGEISQDQVNEITDRYLEIREIMRDEFLKEVERASEGSPSDDSGQEVSQ